MSEKTLSALCTSTPSASRKTKKTKEMQPPQEDAMTLEPQVVVSSRLSSFDAASRTPEFQLAWDNDVRFHVSRNVLQLRKFRGMSQAQLAAAIGTSQSAIARLESGAVNITETTLERIVNALRGRFRVSIAPAEFQVVPQPLWWRSARAAGRSGTSSTWSLRALEVRETTDSQEVRVTLERSFHSDTLPATADLYLGDAKAS